MNFKITIIKSYKAMNENTYQTFEELKQEFCISRQIFIDDVDVLLEAYDASKWKKDKPRKNMWGKLILIERLNYVKDSYFSIEAAPILGKFIRWCELPKPYNTEK